MKIGVKIFNEEDFAGYFEDKADFLEVMAIRGKDYSFLKNYKLPIVIHAEHERFDFNAADKLKKENNISSIKFAIELANFCNSKKIIVHPGYLDSINCSLEEARKFFINLDKRILIENMPINKKRKDYLCTNIKETKEFLSQTKKDLILDINHAVETADSLNLDYTEFLNEFFKLNPKHFHLGGQNLKQGTTHLTLKENELPLKEILKFFPKDAWITLETKNNIQTTEEDIRILRELI